MAQGDTLTNMRLHAQWQIAATLNMNNQSNDLLSIVSTQPDGVYSQADLNEIATWLKWHLGKDGSLALWFPDQVYINIVGKIVNFPYNRAALGESFKPPNTAVGGSGQCSCDEDSYVTPTRDVLCFQWVGGEFIEQTAGSLATGTWTFSGLSAGSYVLVFDDYATNESFPTTYLTVT